MVEKHIVCAVRGEMDVKLATRGLAFVFIIARVESAVVVVGDVGVVLASRLSLRSSLSSSFHSLSACVVRVFVDTPAIADVRCRRRGQRRSL